MSVLRCGQPSLVRISPDTKTLTLPARDDSMPRKTAPIFTTRKRLDAEENFSKAKVQAIRGSDF